MSLTKRTSPRGQRTANTVTPEGVADTLQRVRQEQRERGLTEYGRAVANMEDRWVVACGGSEEPFEYWGERWLYVFHPRSGKHGYLNMSTDVVHEDYRTEVVPC
jgi:hypothetical protein